ncbi:MAG: LiaI-LiaF-like domain-containing protein [Actinomycetota bacterium]
MSRHRLDLLSLVFGALFTLTGILVLAEGTDSGSVALWKLWPVVLVLIGLAMLLAHREPANPEPPSPRQDAFAQPPAPPEGPVGKDD